MATRIGHGRALGVLLALNLLLALLAPAAALAHPDYDEHISVDGIGVQVNAPADLAGFFEAVQWGDSGEIADETAQLVYAGTGCTPASYAAVAADIQGNIALVDSRQSATNPADQCPAFTFAQKAQSAEKAGAIGFVQIPGEGEEPRGNATVVTAEIPALEVHRTDEVLAVRDAVIAGTAVEATLVNDRVEFGAMSDVPCVDGRADVFECDGIDLLSFTPQGDFDGQGVSDLWGWTDGETGDEYVIVGKTNGVALFRVTDPTAPVYLGELENKAALERIWHDVKVYEDHAFIVSESEPHGMKVFDLTRLRDAGREEGYEPQVWDEDAFYPLHSAAHNIAINEDTGFAYIVGGNAGLVVPDVCLSGLHMVDIRDPKSPTFAGCYLLEGGPGTAARSVGSPATELSPAAYVHDTQCVVYDGPDERYTDRELCFNAAEDKVVIADVTDKSNPTTVGVLEYPNTGYAHQGWLTDDQEFLLVNDELDEAEVEGIDNTRTIVLDVTDLENPAVHFEHLHETRSIDHNNYVHDGLVYQSNYTSGLRVLDVTTVPDGSMEEVAFFDTYPASGDPTFDGTWSNYPYFASGTIAVSGIDEGLFLVRLQDGVVEDPVERGVELTCVDCDLQVRAGESGTAQLTVANTGNVEDTYDVIVDGLPAGWTATAEPDPVTVGAGGEAPLEVTVEVPRRAKADTYTLTVAVTSTEDASVTDTAEVVVEVTRGRPSDAGPPSDRGPAERGPAERGAGTADGSGDGAVTSASMDTASAPTADAMPAGMIALAAATVLGLAVATTTRATRRRVR